YALHALAEVGDLLRPFVDQEYDHLDVGLVGHNGVGDLLEQGGLTSLGRRHDEATLTAAYGGEQVDDARGELVARGLELDVLLGEGGGELLEARALGGLERVYVVDGLHADERAVPLVIARAARLAHDVVAGAQAELLDEPGGDDDAAGVVLQERLLQEAVTVGAY